MSRVGADRALPSGMVEVYGIPQRAATCFPPLTEVHSNDREEPDNGFGYECRRREAAERSPTPAEFPVEVGQMPRAFYSIVLDHSADDVWTVIRSFDAYTW